MLSRKEYSLLLTTESTAKKLLRVLYKILPHVDKIKNINKSYGKKYNIDQYNKEVEHFILLLHISDYRLLIRTKVYIKYDNSRKEFDNMFPEIE